ncbi:MAG TPA: DNA methyltransferase [Ktedonobacteraceae bacterium]|jgi:hypothetical protein
MNDTPSTLEPLIPPRAFLNEVYRSLGYEKGALLNAVFCPKPGTDEYEEWVEKGDWLALAHKVGAEKLFFVKNDPVLIFCVLSSESFDGRAILEIFRRVWCMARPLYLFIALSGELRVYRLDRPPARDAETLKSNLLIEPVRRISEVAEKLQAFRRELLESGDLPGDRYFGAADQRADKRLIRDLKAVREKLLETGLSPRYAHALIGRSIFIRYLEDRGVIDETYFLEKVAKQNAGWQNVLLNELDSPYVFPENGQRRYYRVLSDKDFTFALFRELGNDFNGDMFPDVDDEEQYIQSEHLQLIQRFLLGDTDDWQRPLFLWAYDFEIIPIELISNIYEEFYHQENTSQAGVRNAPKRKKQDDLQTHYTPDILVNHTLSHLLTLDRLALKPTILDPACGSGIFLVESFRRIVRYRVKHQNGEMLAPETLREILRRQIKGIELNEEAVRVAAFSLYLALLHYQESPTIRTKRLPNLIYRQEQLEDEYHYHVLFKNNVFALTDEERRQVRETLQKNPRYKRRMEHERLRGSSQIS